MAVTINRVGSLAQGQSESTSGTKFFAGGEDALTLLIQQLLGGGTAEQRAEQVRRAEEVQAVRGQRADYTKGAAFADAAGAQNQQSRLAMEKLIPAIMAAAQGAGTSQNSMRALLMQDAANKAAESAAALGLKASVDYGQIANGQNQVLEALTRPGSPITEALLKALEISKGGLENKVTGSNTAGGGQSAYGNISYGGTMAPTKWGDDLLDGTFNPGTPQYANLFGTGGSVATGEDKYSVNPNYGDVTKPLSQYSTLTNNSGYGSMGSQNLWDNYTF